MSSNYRILLHFLKTLDSSVKIGLGLRNRTITHLIKNDLLKDLKTNVEQKCQSFESIVKQSYDKSTKYNKGKALDKQEVFDRTYVIFEGLRQYLQYISRHKLKVSSVVSQLNKTYGQTSQTPNHNSNKGLILTVPLIFY